MHVWRYRGRRDRRDNGITGLDTMDEHDLEILRKKELDIRAAEEVERCQMEIREIEKFKLFVTEDLNTFFETRNGKDEVSAVGAKLMEDRAAKEKADLERRKANGEDIDDDDDTHVSALTESSMKKNKKKKMKDEKENPRPPPHSEIATQDQILTHHTEEKKEEVDILSITHILTLEPSELNKDQATKLKIFHVFEMFDADAGGTINEEEMRNCVDELCIPMDDDELKTVMKEVDGDESGEVEFEEFYGWYAKISGTATKGKMMSGMALKFAKAMRNYNGESVREEAKRLILATAEREQGEKTLKQFRRSRPPRFFCEVCDEAFDNATSMGAHIANGNLIHGKWKDERAATLERQHPVLSILSGPEARKWRVRRLVHSQHLYDSELDGISLNEVNVWKNRTRPFLADPSDKRGDQLRRGQLVEGFDAKMGKRAGFVQRGFVLRDLRPGEGRTRNHMACNPLLLPDVLLRLYMDKKPHVTKAVRKRSRKKGISLPLDTIENLFLCDPANGQSKAMCSFHWAGLVYQGAFVHGEFNGYKGELMESQGHVSVTGESEFVLERFLSPGVYHYYFIVDGRVRVDMTKPVMGKGKNRRNIITVCNPSVLGAQGGPYTDGRMQSKNLVALTKSGGDVSMLLENSSVDLNRKMIRSREVSRQGGGVTGETQHKLNALLAPSGEGMEPQFNPSGGKRMEKIELIHNLVCDDGSWALSQAMFDNHRVTHLDLSSNLITSDGISHLAQMLEKNCSISKLFLNSNNIGYDGARALATAFVNNDELQIRELEIASNCLGDDGAEALSVGLAGCGTLTSCNLDGNRIHDDGAAAIGDMLTHNKILVRLSLAYNLIKKDGAYHLGEALKRNCALKFLNLNRNPLGPGGLACICQMMRQNDSINVLKVGYAQVLSEQGVMGLFELCKMLRVNRSLQSLELSGNDFGESDLRKLLAALHDLDNPSLWTRKRNITLFELLLLDNHFDGEWMQKDKMVVREGFPSLPSVPLFVHQNMEEWAKLDEEKRNGMIFWLQMKKNKRKDAEKRRKERKAEMQKRVADQKLAQMKHNLPPLLEGEAGGGGGGEGGGGGGKRKKKKKKKKNDDDDDGDEDGNGNGDNNSVSSLGSFDFLGGGGGVDDDTSSVLTDNASYSNTIQNNNFVGGGGGGGGGGDNFGDDYSSNSDDDDDSDEENSKNKNFSIKDEESFFGFNVDEMSLGPSIDSDFLASMRSSLFGGSSITTNSDNAQLTPAQRKKLGLFKNSSMYDALGGENSKDESSAQFTQSLDGMAGIISGSIDSDSVSVKSSSTASSMSLFSKDTAASLLVDRAATENAMMRHAEQIKQVRISDSVVGFGSTMGGDVSLLGSVSGMTMTTLKPTNKKLYAREEGEWRKDRTWISQRSLDRTARRLEEDKARALQVSRQTEEDEYVEEKIKLKEEFMTGYFKKDDGQKMIEAVVDELKDLRKEETAKKMDELNEIKRKDLINHTDFYSEAKLRHEVQLVFNIFDGDASGQIGADELGDLMKELCLPMTKKELKKLMGKLDGDKSGELDFDEFFAWYKDNYKEQKQTSFVEGLKLKANHFVNSKMGSTANMEAKRILLSNEMKDVITIAKHEFRQKRKPQFECMECHSAFIDKKRKKEHDKNVEQIHENYYLLHERAKARHKLVDLARYRVTKGESYPKFFIYPEDVVDHIELQIFSMPDEEVGRPLGVINHNSTVMALQRSGEKGTGDWLRLKYKNFEEAWVKEKSRRPYKEHLVPMPTGMEDNVEEEKRKMKLALAGKKDDGEGAIKSPPKKKDKKKKKKKKTKIQKLNADGIPIEGEFEEEEEEGEEKEEEEKDVNEWPRKGHLEFFSIPKWYSIAEKYAGSGLELNVRAQPEMDSPLIGHIIDTEAVKCSATFGDWIQVQYKVYDNAWMLIRNKAHDLLKPVPRETAERAESGKRSPWDWTFDYILNKATADHITAGSRDALGAAAEDANKDDKVSTSTKAQLGLDDQLTDDV